jgi:Ca2+-binding RTX toxin-like protein
MKRFLLLVTVASMLAAALALSGVAQAAPIGGKTDAQCAKLAIQTLGPGVNPSNYTFHGGTEGNDLDTFTPTEGPDVFCGFGGDDLIITLAEGDIFLGGVGDDEVGTNNGTFYGQEGDDLAAINNSNFFGGAGNDTVFRNLPGSTFDGGDGTDRVDVNLRGILINVEQGDV